MSPTRKTILLQAYTSTVWIDDGRKLSAARMLVDQGLLEKLFGCDAFAITPDGRAWVERWLTPSPHSAQEFFRRQRDRGELRELELICALDSHWRIYGFAPAIAWIARLMGLGTAGMYRVVRLARWRGLVMRTLELTDKGRERIASGPTQGSEAA